MNYKPAFEMVVLQTCLFGEQSDMLTAVKSLEEISIKFIKLEPEKMEDADWDAVIDHCLRAKKVVTS